MKIKIIFSLLYLCCFYKAQSQIMQEPLIDSAAKTREEKITLTLEANYMRHYLWRGTLFGNDDVSQPIIDIGYKNFGVTLSANLNYIPKNLPKENYKKNVVYDEQDVEIYYANTFKKIAYLVRADGYFYFNQLNTPNTFEAATVLEYPISKTFTAYSETVLDIGSYKGSLYNYSGIKWNYTIHKNDIDIQTGISFCNNKFSNTYYYADVNGLLYVGGKAEISHRFKNFYATVTGEFYHYTNKAIIEATQRNYTTNFSVALGKEINIQLKRNKHTTNAL